MDDRSERNLLGVHTDLVKVIRKAFEDAPAIGISFVVTEGLRTREKQAENVRLGASQTMNSRHLTGHAVDLAVKVGGQVRWDYPLYDRLSKVVKDSANALGVKIIWGGDWLSLRDGPHYELDRRDYP